MCSLAKLRGGREEITEPASANSCTEADTASLAIAVGCDLQPSESLESLRAPGTNIAQGGVWNEGNGGASSISHEYHMHSSSHMLC